MDHTDSLEHAYEDLAKLVANVDANHLAAPTPCPEWDARALLNQVLGAGRMFTLANAGIRSAEFWAPMPLDPLRAANAFGPPIHVDETAPVAHRLLGYLGRHP